MACNLRKRLTFSSLSFSIYPPVSHDKVTASMNAAIFRFFFYFSA
ncbi:pheST operon leader peptide PheM [Pantoea sp. Bo_2]|uniref:pheST attenuator peptide n=1 Tax=Candidatus Pantoea gossypiicola TaxID=2608008 RepID=A0AB34CPE7_9GAMM|nr:pheST operon leader peptide PheM [Pantoea sp. VH_8]KAA5932035.1 pheST operon leader peptide PheM [Pantoea sp. VH_4]KAA5945905.1 pheST operon leader peptide PheM [Pantoea sp. VH_3]KAA5953246.1 pheST operon leader peptide PheM [Pantoea sp. VH_25]KAA5953830.1 pheST operon leader peptide PheM [Pantoea sp. VH_24]KAA5959631.1 pheST operon leader peptide PheM [Pantoea sp. VH_16]KAA5963380.1 pheST operon leader peptide PheM [Pantoea sp. VH_18]KAA5983334.1 pheST operon leader peptide PheM [Pantoea